MHRWIYFWRSITFALKWSIFIEVNNLKTKVGKWLVTPLPFHQRWQVTRCACCPTRVARQEGLRASEWGPRLCWPTLKCTTMKTSPCTWMRVRSACLSSNICSYIVNKWLLFQKRSFEQEMKWCFGQKFFILIKLSLLDIAWKLMAIPEYLHTLFIKAWQYCEWPSHACYHALCWPYTTMQPCLSGMHDRVLREKTAWTVCVL